MDYFNFQEHKNLAKLIQKYVLAYKQPPTLDTLKVFANSLSSTDKDTEEYVEVLKLAKDLPKIGMEEANFYFEQLENYKMGRDIYDLATDLKEKFENNESDFFKIRQNLLDKLLRTGRDKRHIKRNFIYENVPERWEEYKRISGGLDKRDIIPWGIKDLDKTVGGLRRSHVTLLYARTSGGKTIAAINAAYNAALAGYHVMFFTLEMEFNNVASKFDSRMAWVDSHDILFGRLRGTDIKQYNNVLKKQLDDKLGIWLVDIPRGTQATDIMKEIELYKFMHGVAPDLVVIDYANLVKPSEKFQGRSERYDYLFSEFHEIARYYKVALITGAQESRTATKRVHLPGRPPDSRRHNGRVDFPGIRGRGLPGQSDRYPGRTQVVRSRLRGQPFRHADHQQPPAGGRECVQADGLPDRDARDVGVDPCTFSGGRDRGQHPGRRREGRHAGSGARPALYEIKPGSDVYGGAGRQERRAVVRAVLETFGTREGRAGGIDRRLSSVAQPGRAGRPRQPQPARGLHREVRCPIARHSRGNANASRSSIASFGFPWQDRTRRTRAARPASSQPPPRHRPRRE